jgi:hypothetical protein
MICYSVGYRAGTKQSPLKEDLQGRLVIATIAYRSGEATNWTKVHGLIGMQIHSMTREYERRFGVPSVADPFAPRFTSAQAIAKQVETRLVPLGAVLTNLPVAPKVKITVE